MNRYPDPQKLQQNAQRLRREALAGIAHDAAIKWRSLRWIPHAPNPSQVAAPSHP